MLEIQLSTIISSVIYTMVTSWRELLEAALIIGIIFGYLNKVDRKDLRKDVYYGIVLAIIASLGLALLFIIFFESLEEYQALIEGLVMIVAAGVLSWMILWMWKQARGIKGDLEKKLTVSISDNQRRGLILLVFFSVFRELGELILFLYASYADVTVNVGMIQALASVISGFTIGLFLALIFSYILFSSTKQLNLKKFFNITSVILIIFAAGLVAHGIHEIYEFLEVSMPNLANSIVFHQVWNVNDFLGNGLKLFFGWSYDGSYPNRFEKSIVGGILTGLFGWNDNPAFLEVAGYISYYIAIGLSYFYIKNKPITSDFVEKVSN